MQRITFKDDLFALVKKGKKTQTRRLCKNNQSDNFYKFLSGSSNNLQILAINENGTDQKIIQIESIKKDALHNLTAKDLIDEGMPYHPDIHIHMLPFTRLWFEIYGIDNWLSNPEVWVIKFNLA